MSKDPKFGTARLLLLGTAHGKGDKPLLLMRSLLDEEWEGRCFTRPEDEDGLVKLYGGKATRHLKGSPGSIFRVELANPEGTSIYASTARYEGHWPDAEARTRWQAASRATERELAALAEQRRRVNAADDLDTHLAALREAYQAARGKWRPQLLAYYVERITR